MIVLDTNVISEIFRPAQETGVVDWLASLTGDVVITSVAHAELLSGVRRLPDSGRKTALAKSIEPVLGQYRGSRSVLPFDEAAAECY
ncbi:PIN domain-containing protein [Glutamicibacter arilaitensis]|uniref:PIN domain-containing protein n=1 Tax=Glutamicibacter arilaitensis TaxID=256701 RepID=UPI003F91F2BB